MSIWQPIETAPRGVVKQVGFLGEGPVIAVSDGTTLALVQWQTSFVPKFEYAHLRGLMIDESMMEPCINSRHNRWALVHAGSNAESYDFEFEPLYWCDPKHLLPRPA